MKADKEMSKDEQVAKAAQVLAEDRQRKMEACMNEIQAVLDKYGFDLAVTNPSITLVQKSIVPADGFPKAPM